VRCEEQAGVAGDVDAVARGADVMGGYGGGKRQGKRGCRGEKADLQMESPDWVQWTGAARDANPASIPNRRLGASDHAAVPGHGSHRPARPGRAIWDNRGHAGVVPAWSRDEGAFARVG